MPWTVVRHTSRLVAAIATAAAGACLIAGPAAAGDVVGPSQQASVSVANAAQGPRVNALGARLVNRFFSLLQSRDIAGLSEFLAPAYQVERIDGSGSAKAAYLTNPAKVSQFTIGDVVATEFEDILVVRYQVSTSEIIDSSTYGSTKAPRMSVFARNRQTHRWQLLMHANFNRPVGQPRSKDITSAQSPSALGLITHFMNLLVKQDRPAIKAFLSPAFQVQRDDGTSADRDLYAARPPLLTDYALADFQVTRQRDVIVARYLAATTQLIHGRKVVTAMSPHIAVLARDEHTGRWQMAAYANLTPVG